MGTAIATNPDRDADTDPPDRTTPTDEEVAAVRAFGRFYTRILGVLAEGMHETPYSLTEARLVYELAQRDETEVVDLRRALGVDAGYLSRLLGRFAADGMVERERSSHDGRRQIVRLTPQGRGVFQVLDGRSADQVRALLAGLDLDQRRRLVAAMGTVEGLLGEVARPDTVVLRPVETGDYGWIVQRHGLLYAQEQGWDETFEALVARIVADFIDTRQQDPKRVAGWIAEVHGQPVGCVFCVQGEGDPTTAQLRLLLVDPSVRGVGLGRRLVDECVRFARRTGYQRIILWTHTVTADAVRLYERAGFELVEEEPHHDFGHDLVGLIYSLDLT